jgi:glyoxylase-like metal-dependent hydrolase (beta-lactamase superfamily II)
MEIVEGIHRVDEASANIAHANVYLKIDGDELTVIDTGTSGNAKKIVAYIQKLGHQPTDIKIIVLTHFHMDHMGSAKELKQLTHASWRLTSKTQTTFREKDPYPNPRTCCSEPFPPLSSPKQSRLT